MKTLADTETAPIACTLDAGSFKDRLAWIAQLNARALVASTRGDLALRLEYRRDALDDVRKLVRQEQKCCGFLGFDLDESGDRVVVTITASEAAREASDMMFEQFTQQSAAASACGCQSGCEA